MSEGVGLAVGLALGLATVSPEPSGQNTIAAIPSTATSAASALPMRTRRRCWASRAARRAACRSALAAASWRRRLFVTPVPGFFSFVTAAPRRVRVIRARV